MQKHLISIAGIFVVFFASLSSFAGTETQFHCRDLVSGNFGMILNFTPDLQRVSLATFSAGGGSDSFVTFKYSGIQEAARFYNAVIDGKSELLVVQESMLGAGGGVAQLDGVSFRCISR